MVAEQMQWWHKFIEDFPFMRNKIKIEAFPSHGAEGGTYYVLTVTDPNCSLTFLAGVFGLGADDRYAHWPSQVRVRKMTMFHSKTWKHPAMYCEGWEISPASLNATQTTARFFETTHVVLDDGRLMMHPSPEFNLQVAIEHDLASDTAKVEVSAV